MKELSALFKQVRKKKGLSQKELSENSNVVQCTISRFERGMQNITLETAIRIAKALKDRSLMAQVKSFITNKLNIN